jgi:hypothetical protein
MKPLGRDGSPRGDSHIRHSASHTRPRPGRGERHASALAHYCYPPTPAGRWLARLDADSPGSEGLLGATSRDFASGRSGQAVRSITAGRVWRSSSTAVPNGRVPKQRRQHHRDLPQRRGRRPFTGAAVARLLIATSRSQCVSSAGRVTRRRRGERGQVARRRVVGRDSLTSTPRSTSSARAASMSESTSCMPWTAVPAAGRRSRCPRRSSTPSREGSAGRRAFRR